MLTFTLAITCLTIQFALIYGPNIPCSYAILLFTALNLASTTSHNHNCVLVLLWLFLFILSGFISPLISSSIPTNLGNSSFKVLYFCLFILFMGLSRQEYWSGLPFPSPVDQLPWWLRWYKRLLAMQETQVWSLGWENPLEKEMATHSSSLAWKIPWMEESHRLQYMGSQRVRHDWVI